jgi:hypothetical protein
MIPVGTCLLNKEARQQRPCVLWTPIVLLVPGHKVITHGYDNFFQATGCPDSMVQQASHGVVEFSAFGSELITAESTWYGGHATWIEDGGHVTERTH